MTLVIDTSIFVEAERRGLSMSAIVERFPEDEALIVPAVVIAELLVGVHLGDPQIRRMEREVFVERIVDEIPVLDFDVGVAHVYAAIWAALRKAGGLIPPHDLMIGATALYHGAEVLTLNLRDFSRIPGLQVRQPNW